VALEPAAGKPEMTPVRELSESPEGSEPEVSVKEGAGEPVACTVKVPLWLSTKLAVGKLVITGGCVTVRETGIEVAGVPMPLLTTTWY
jgi:hypothetical protein